MSIDVSSSIRCDAIECTEVVYWAVELEEYHWSSVENLIDAAAASWDDCAMRALLLSIVVSGRMWEERTG